MASPPFSIAETIPEDDDIVSQFPATERTFRDVVESWLLVNHNVQGRHDELALDFKADPSAPGASITEVWASSTGNAAGALKQRSGASGTVEYVGPPPGSVLPYAGTTEPNGWVFCYGQAISRTTFARLFDVISTTYGSGDGSTTFNVPDLRGRVVAGQDDMGGSSANRLTDQTGGVNGDTLGAAGGSETHTLLDAQMPAHDHGGATGADGEHLHLLVADTSSETALSGNPTRQISTSSSSGGYAFGGTTTAATIGESDTEADHTHTIAADGSDAAHNNVQPTLILNYIIKL
jgi:microcystin-dependent protein